MPMKNPPRVDGLIRREAIEPLGLTVTEPARALRVGRQALSRLLNEKSTLTSDMALRVEKAFGSKMTHEPWQSCDSCSNFTSPLLQCTAHVGRMAP
jgi:addiction module HigA family antidote